MDVEDLKTAAFRAHDLVEALRNCELDDLSVLDDARQIESTLWGMVSKAGAGQEQGRTEDEQ